MRPRRPPTAGGDAGLLKNVFFLLSISGIFFYFFYIGNQSVSGYVPRLELVTDVDGGGSSASEDYDYDDGEINNSPHSADRAVLERYLDEKTETIQRDAKEAIEEAQKAKEEAEKLKLEMVKVKEEASDARKKQQREEKEKAKKIEESENFIQRDVKKAKEEAQKAKEEAEKLKLQVAQAKKEVEEAREQQTKREEKAKLESEKLKREVAQAKEEAAKVQREAEEAAARAEEKEKTKRKKSKKSKGKEQPDAREEDTKVTDTPEEGEVQTDETSTSDKEKKSTKDKQSEKEVADTQKEDNDTKKDKKKSSEGKGNNNNNKNDKKPPLNVIVLYPDDWGGRDLQDVNPTLKTPTFSQLAKEGMRFPFNAVTTSICWISRAALFTGQYVSSHKSMYLFRPTFTKKENWAHSWPHILQRDAGYYVGHIGKWQYRDTGNLKKIFNWTSFFEGWTVMIDRKMGNRTYNAELARDETFRFLKERPKDKPFAATVAFYPPKGIHKVMEVKPELAALYTNMTHPEAYDRAMAYSRLPPFLQDNETLARDRYLYRFETHGDFQETIAAQYATLTHIDTMCGEIIQELKRQGVYENTMIIVTADNGEFHGAHALADKWYPYSESIHVPLIIKDPRMPKKKRGKLDDSFTLNIDLAETILGAAGLDPAKEMEGRDISDLYLDKPKSTKPWREEFYYDFPQVNGKIPASYAIVRKDWKYINWYMHGTEELFDMKEDPFELNNVANHSKHSKVKAKLKHQLQVMRHNAYYPRIPDSRCDPLQPSGGDRASMPNCSQVFPDRCCPHWFNDQMV